MWHISIQFDPGMHIMVRRVAVTTDPETVGVVPSPGAHDTLCGCLCFHPVIVLDYLKKIKAIRLLWIKNPDAIVRICNMFFWMAA